MYYLWLFLIYIYDSINCAQERQCFSYNLNYFKMSYRSMDYICHYIIILIVLFSQKT
jgi:hypothetical protein